MEKEYIKKQIKHIQALIEQHLEDGQKLVIERKGDIKKKIDEYFND